MESPVVSASSQEESPIQFVSTNNSSPLDNFEIPFNHGLAYQTPADSRMSSVGPMSDWAYQQPQMVQQQPQFQMQQNNNRMSISYTEKALPPIPPEMHEEHSITPRPSNISQQQHHQMDTHDLHHDFETWSLVGSTIAEDPSMPNGLPNGLFTDHFH